MGPGVMGTCSHQDRVHSKSWGEGEQPHPSRVLLTHPYHVHSSRVMVAFLA